MDICLRVLKERTNIGSTVAVSGTVSGLSRSSVRFESRVSKGKSFPPVRHGYVTEVNWPLIGGQGRENAAQGLGNNKTMMKRIAKFENGRVS